MKKKVEPKMPKEKSMPKSKSMSNKPDLTPILRRQKVDSNAYFEFGKKVDSDSYFESVKSPYRTQTSISYK